MLKIRKSNQARHVRNQKKKSQAQHIKNQKNITMHQKKSVKIQIFPRFFICPLIGVRNAEPCVNEASGCRGESVHRDVAGTFFFENFDIKHPPCSKTTKFISGDAG